jgi:hypothetical protein
LLCWFFGFIGGVSCYGGDSGGIDVGIGVDRAGVGGDCGCYVGRGDSGGDTGVGVGVRVCGGLGFGVCVGVDGFGVGIGVDGACFGSD